MMKLEKDSKEARTIMHQAFIASKPVIPTTV